MLSVDAALKQILDRLNPSSSFQPHLMDALHHCLAEHVVASMDLPRFDNSQMDGYALRAADLFEKEPTLECAMTIAAGDVGAALSKGQCARIFTGAAIPEGADCVIAQEDAEREGDQVRFFSEPRVGQFIRKRGSDVAMNTVLLARKERLSPAKAGLLASQGAYHPKVYHKPSIGYVLSGDELAIEGEEVSEWGVRSCNGEIFESMLKPLSSEITDYGKTGDTLQDVMARLELAPQHDLFILSGGASVGDRDYTREALQQQGYDILFDRVALRPGKPFTAAVKDGRLVVGVPGNPVSTLVTSQLFLKPACLKLAGARVESRRFYGVLNEAVNTPPHLMTCLRGRFFNQGEQTLVTTDFNQNSGALGATAKANCLAIVPEGVAKMDKGMNIEILPLDDGMEWL